MAHPRDYVCPVMTNAIPAVYTDRGERVQESGTSFAFCDEHCVALETRILEGKYPSWRCTAVNSPWREGADESL